MRSVPFYAGLMLLLFLFLFVLGFGLYTFIKFDHNSTPHKPTQSIPTSPVRKDDYTKYANNNIFAVFINYINNIEIELKKGVLTKENIHKYKIAVGIANYLHSKYLHISNVNMEHIQHEYRSLGASMNIPYNILSDVNIEYITPVFLLQIPMQKLIEKWKNKN